MSRQNDADTWPTKKKWHYDEHSGEFYPITGKFRGTVTYDVITFNQRMSLYLNKRKEVMWQIYLISALLILSIFFILAGYWVAFLFFGFFLLGLLRCGIPLWRLHGKVGPEPRRKPVDTEAYGSMSALSGDNHPAAEDISYKPQA